MNAKMIVILMMLVLLALFIWSKYFRKNEMIVTKLEVESFEAMKRWQETQTEELKKDAFNKMIALSLAKGLSQEKAEHHAEKQFKTLTV